MGKKRSADAMEDDTEPLSAVSVAAAGAAPADTEGEFECELPWVELYRPADVSQLLLDIMRSFVDNSLHIPLSCPKLWETRRP